MAKKNDGPKTPGIIYPHPQYSLKIEYVEEGQRRFMMTGYQTQDSFFDLFLSWRNRYQGCVIEKVSLVRVIFEDQINHSDEETVGEITLPFGYNWLDEKTWPKM